MYPFFDLVPGTASKFLDLFSTCQDNGSAVHETYTIDLKISGQGHCRRGIHCHRCLWRLFSLDTTMIVICAGYSQISFRYDETGWWAPSAFYASKNSPRLTSKLISHAFEGLYHVNPKEPLSISPLSGYCFLIRFSPCGGCVVILPWALG